MRSFFWKPTALMLMGLLIGGCGKQPDSQSQKSAQTASLPSDHADTKRYRISINLPQLPATAAPLTKTLRQVANEAKQDFLKSLPDPAKFPEFAHQQMTLTLDFRLVAQTARFISVREDGGEYTGGAHPIPVAASFVYDRKRQQLVPLGALFKTPDKARETLAHFARDSLLKRLEKHAQQAGSNTAQWRKNNRQMIREGTRPNAANISSFVVRSGSDEKAKSPSISLIFPPYQVAPYVAGTQLVEVPAAVFTKLLKSSYQSAFTP